MIIIEGPDGAGKSDLAFRLATATRGSIVQAGGPTSGPDDWRRRVEVLIGCRDSDAIFDRTALISEQVYGPILRGGCVVHDVEINEMERRFLNKHGHQHVLLYARPRSQTILANAVEVRAHKPEEHVLSVIAARGAIVAAYDRLMSRLKGDGWRVVRCDYDWELSVDDPTVVDWEGRLG